jgi:hypothetical protein
MAENRDPFFVIDDAQVSQSLLVVKRGSGSDERVLPYSLAELVSSSVTINDFGYLTSSINDISSSLANISSSTDISSSLEQIYSQLTASYNYATASYDHLTASSGYLSSISSSISSSNDLLTDISSSEVVIYNTLTASHDQLTASNVTLVALSQSADRTYNYLTAALEQITSSISQSTNYLKEINAYCRATHVSSSIFSGSELQGLDLAQTNLIPDLNYNEQYLRACVDVLIQNSTNKDCYIKISHLPEASVSHTDYTIKLPPGVIYNSEAQIASMRHVIYVTGSEDILTSGMYGEVSAMLTYNSALRSDVSLPNLIYPNTIKSLAVNAYNFQNSKVVLNEWTYAPQGTSPAVYDKMVIVGQARISVAGEELTLTLESGSFIAASASITNTEPQTFIMETSSCPAGRYEFIAHGTDLFAYGNGRVLFADLLITTGSV